MKKTIRQKTTNPPRTRQRKLELTRETVRTLDADELSQAIGGDVTCVTTSYTTSHR